MTEEHKKKLALGREKALANRRAKAQAKKVQKELDVLELKKMRESNQAQLDKLKAQPKPEAPAPQTPEPLELPEAAVPEKEPVRRKKKKKRKIVVMEESSSEEEIIVVRAPRRKREKPQPPQRQQVDFNQWSRPQARPIVRQPTPEEIESDVRKRRQAFLTKCMGDRWR